MSSDSPKRGAILLHEDGSIYISLGDGSGSVVYEASPRFPKEIGHIQFSIGNSAKVKVIGYIDDDEDSAPTVGRV